MKKNRIVLCETGGTFSMDYISTETIKNSLHAPYKENGPTYQKYPVYDMRHFLLAAEVSQATISQQKKEELLIKIANLGALLVDIKTKQLKKSSNAIISKLQDTHEKTMNSILKEISFQGNTSTLLEQHNIAPSPNCENPYRIDSIDFTTEDHYPLLKKCSKKALKTNHTTFIVIGGTDTQEFYAGMLARDLKNEGFLEPHTGNKIVFLSSMLSFGYDKNTPPSEPYASHIYPAHIGKYMLAALKISQLSITGGFSLAAENAEVSDVIIHDIFSHFTKISSHIPNAFRSTRYIKSSSPENMIENYFSSSAPISSLSHNSSFLEENRLYSNIAPPILGCDDVQTLSTLFHNSLCLNTPLDGFIIQINKNLLASVFLDPQKEAALTSNLMKLSQQKIRTIWINDLSFHESSQTIRPEDPELEKTPQFNKFYNLFIKDKPFSQYINNATLIESYVEETLKTKNHFPRLFNHTLKPIKTISAVGIKYVPNISSFRNMLSLLDQTTSTIVISTLPGQALPKVFSHDFNQLTLHGNEVYFSFKYNGIKFKKENYTEGLAGNDYAAGIDPEKEGIITAGMQSPSQILRSLRICNDLAQIKCSRLDGRTTCDANIVELGNKILSIACDNTHGWIQPSSHPALTPALHWTKNENSNGFVINLYCGKNYLGYFNLFGSDQCTRSPLGTTHNIVNGYIQISEKKFTINNFLLGTNHIDPTIAWNIDQVILDNMHRKKFYEQLSYQVPLGFIHGFSQALRQDIKLARYHSLSEVVDFALSGVGLYMANYPLLPFLFFKILGATLKNRLGFSTSKANYLSWTLTCATLLFDKRDSTVFMYSVISALVNPILQQIGYEAGGLCYKKIAPNMHTFFNFPELIPENNNPTNLGNKDETRISRVRRRR